MDINDFSNSETDGRILNSEWFYKKLLNGNRLKRKRFGYFYSRMLSITKHCKLFIKIDEFPNVYKLEYVSLPN